MVVPAALPLDAERARSSLARLLLLVGGLLVLDLLMTYGTVEAVQLRRTAGWPPVELIFLGTGWGGFTPIALAVWLTWGGGRIALRLLAVLGLVAIQCGFAAYFQHRHFYNEMRLSFLGWLLFTLAQILILHALAYPLRKTLHWRLTFRPAAEHIPAPKMKTQWSLLDALGWTAFAAMALALVRLHSMFLDNTLTSPQPLAHWLNFITLSVPGVISFPLIAWAVWGKQLGPIRRMALIVLALAAAFCSQQGFLLAQSGRGRLSWTLAIASGVVASALVHCIAMWMAGVRWGQAEGNGRVR